MSCVAWPPITRDWKFLWYTFPKKWSNWATLQLFRIVHLRLQGGVGVANCSQKSAELYVKRDLVGNKGLRWPSRHHCSPVLYRRHRAVQRPSRFAPNRFERETPWGIPETVWNRRDAYRECHPLPGYRHLACPSYCSTQHLWIFRSAGPAPFWSKSRRRSVTKRYSNGRRRRTCTKRATPLARHQYRRSSVPHIEDDFRSNLCF